MTDLRRELAAPRRAIDGAARGLLLSAAPDARRRPPTPQERSTPCRIGPATRRIDGPIVMIGFGSIGKGTLPLIERHFDYDKERFVVIDPDGSDRKLLDERGIKFVHLAITRDNYREVLGKLLHRRRRPGLLRQSVGRHLLARHHALLPRDRRALYRHRRRAVAGLLFRQVARQRVAHQLRAARDGARRAARQSRRHDRGLLLRRQSGHGLLVRQAGARQSRRRSRRHGGRAEDARGLGPARAAARRQGRAHRRARHAARQEPEAAQRLRQHLVGRGLSLRGHAAGRARLGHAREMDARQRRLPQRGLRRGDLSQPARRQHPRALVDADRAGAVRLPRHPQRVDLDRRLLTRCATTRARRSIARPATTPITPATTRCCRLHELFGRAGEVQKEHHILGEAEILDGIDELGVLLYGHARNAYWYGSQLSVEETRAIAPYQNATGMQVTSAVLAGMVWALENPNAGIVEADEMDYRRCLEVQTPYLGPVIGVYTDWTPLTDRPGLFPEDIDESDPWQFRNVLVR